MIRFGGPVSGLTAFRTGRRLLGVGSGLGIGVDLRLEEPGGQVPPEFAGPLLPLVESDELVLVFGTEHEIESGGSVTEPALAECLPLGIGVGLSSIHGGGSR